uniref:Uncharacterized protein n=1 Tax=uncultured haloarchaeon TaxID=160804 RepID=A0A0K1YBG7_9EURY|nr:hypothetical protein [uncultured haloarchaeon]
MNPAESPDIDGCQTPQNDCADLVSPDLLTSSHD